ncbi:hypothetical protein [Paenibacillus sp. YIM B09110]|uniref:hypothetical protein n=1 Tax=Paenibacillus sp. YIM B09110 TaxID=3126102 RepID=UPI00301D27F4
MRKYIIGFIIGAFVMVSGQVLADGVSKVGKTIQKEATVTLDGQALSNAVIVDAKSYAPVRDIVEAFGASVSYEKGVVKIETQGIDLSVLKRNKENLAGRIINTEKIISALMVVEIPTYENAVANTSEDKDTWQKRLYEAKELLKSKQAELVDLKLQLAEIDKQIAELESAE